MKFLIIISVSFLVILFSCQKDEEDTRLETIPITNSYLLDIKEPSGLTFDNHQNVLYTVSDNTNKIYKMSVKGIVFQSYNYEGNDLEGIAIGENGNLMVAEERNRQIVKYIQNTDEIKVFNVKVEQRDNNSGLEGLCYNSIDNTYFVLNEKNPGLLIVLNNNLEKSAEYSLNFALDYSGMCYDTNEDKIWIISDQSKTLTKCDKKGNKLMQYNLNIDKPEGLALDINNKIFYIVSDSKNILYEIEYPN